MIYFVRWMTESSIKTSIEKLSRFQNRYPLFLNFAQTGFTPNSIVSFLLNQRGSNEVCVTWEGRALVRRGKEKIAVLKITQRLAIKGRCGSHCHLLAPSALFIPEVIALAVHALHPESTQWRPTNKLQVVALEPINCYQLGL